MKAMKKIGHDVDATQVVALRKYVCAELDMAFDLRKLRPADIVRLLNSTPLGEVCDDRRVRQDRGRAGLRIGDDKAVDLLRYAAWLCLELRERRAPTSPGDYEAYKERQRQRMADQSRSGRDIGELPAVVNLERRAKARSDFRFFCEQYFAGVFHLGWSDDHLKVIAKIEMCVLHGGLFAMAMPRGSGKTSLCEAASLWAILYGHRRFVTVIAADEGLAVSSAEAIKTSIETNDELLDDFPEVCFPVRKLEGIAQRANGQLYRGENTRIVWTEREIVLPTIEGSVASGAILRLAGITGRIRGMKFVRPDGESARPDLVLVDDPQTDESARSPSQCAAREQILNGAILGLAGPGRTIAGLMTVTVVRNDDLADRILDRARNPHWQAERTKMVYSFPADTKLWDEYAKIIRSDTPDAERRAQATAFYRKNRAAMDAGAVVAWPARHNPDELSALQHAMTLKIRSESAFWAEYQNEPLPETHEAEDVLDVSGIVAKINGLARGAVPIECSRITGFVDVQGKALFWLVAAWGDDFTGHVIDYGTEPEQQLARFTLRDVRRTLATAAPRAGQEGAIRAGLDRLIATIGSREWRRDDGAVMRADRILIDANWGAMTEVVYQFCRQSPLASILTPSHGKYVGAAGNPMSEYKKRPGDRVGLNWRVPAIAGKRSSRHVIFDTNFWKTFIHERLRTAAGDPGCLSLFGRDGERHRLLAEHLTAEHSVRTQGRGRTVDEWRLRATGLDNHWFDCLVGAAVAASMSGVTMADVEQAVTKRARVKLSELQRKRA